jgi:hypothetical protein
MKKSLFAVGDATKSYALFALLMLGFGLLVGCAGPGSFGPNRPPPGVAKSGASVVGVNHSQLTIYTFNINGGGGSRAPKRWPSSGTACCVMIPDIWTPGLVGKVTWKPNGEPYRTKLVPIEPYSEIGTVYVHFFDNDEVRVVVANAGAENPAHPIPWVPLPCEPTFKRDANGEPLYVPGTNCPPPRQD